MSICQKTAHELHELLSKKEISATELMQNILLRIDQVEDKVRAFVLKPEQDNASSKAQDMDKILNQGEGPVPLAGLPMVFQDNICTKGIRTTAASKMLENFIPPYSATVAEKMQQAQAILIGKTNLDEFGLGSSTESSFFGPTRNPWNQEYVPGGSGGGTAAAIAADEAVFALGSDILKSAAFCGVVGFKPTYGWVSRYGLVGTSSSLEQIGPVTKDVTDCAWVLNELVGHDLKDTVSSEMQKPDFRGFLTGEVRGLKIGLPKEYFAGEMDDEIKALVLAAVKQLESLGAVIEEVSLPQTTYAQSAYQIIAAGEAGSVMGRYEGVRFGYRREDAQDIESHYRLSRSEGFGLAVKRQIILGTHVLSKGNIDTYYMNALKTRTLIRQDFDQAFQKVDLLVSPTCFKPVFKLGGGTEDLSYTNPELATMTSSLAGIPAISLPCGFRQGLPVGMQFMGQAFNDGKLLQAAFAYEQEAKWMLNKPNLSGEGQ